MSDTTIALLLTLAAGLATGIGSFIAFFVKSENKPFLAASLGFSAGVMLYVSMLEMLPNGKNYLVGNFSPTAADFITVAAFFGGILLIAFIERVIPSPEQKSEKQMLSSEGASGDKGLLRTGVFTALAIGIHNFPEGLATFVSALSDTSIGVSIAIAIAIHNIPEGIAVSAPIFAATGSKKKAFFMSFLSGIAEPIGALLGWLILMPLLNDILFGVIFAVVSGIMVFISIDELLPSALETGRQYYAVYGFVAGMAVMAVSLCLL